MIDFNDIKKAFDNVDKNTMSKILRDARIEYRDRRIILQLNKNHRPHTDECSQQERISKRSVRDVVSLRYCLICI